MSVNSNIAGGLQEPVSVRLTTTSNTDIFEAEDRNISIISMSIANETAGAVTISVFWFDDSAATSYLVFRSSIPADGTVIITDIPLRLADGDKVTATAASANALTVNLIRLQSFNQNTVSR